MIEQFRQSLDNGEPESESFGPIALWILDLIKLLEDMLLMLARDAASGVENLNAQAVATTTSHHHATAVGIAHGIRHDVTHDALQQYRVAADRRRTGMQHQTQALLFRLAPIFVAYALEQRLNRECFETRLDNAGVKTRDIQQRAEQIVHGAYRAVDMVDQSLCFNIHRPGAQRADEHAQRMDRLAQIVTCGREEARFCQVRVMSQIALVA